jgi:hypothetical protein
MITATPFAPAHADERGRAGHVNAPVTAVITDPARQTERRAWTRYPTQLETFCRQAVGGPEMCWSGIIQNISRGGIRLLMHRRFEPGALLKVDVPVPIEQPGPYFISRVIYATLQPDGTWALGCAFTEELDETLMWTILKAPANHLPAEA